MQTLIKTNDRILITGAQGFLGNYVVNALRSHRYRNLFCLSRGEFDLRKLSAIKKLLKIVHPQIILHLAGDVGGIGYNLNFPGTLFYDNLIMGAQLMEEARKGKVKKFVSVGSICAYPKFTPVPFKEEDIWNGYPEETNAPYGLAKKMHLVQANAYRKQHGFNAVTVFLTNLYGPGDNFDERSSHVIPAIIKKCCRAVMKKDKKIILWGTGKPTRDFLYVEDAARGILSAMQRYNKPEPLNLGSGKEISIEGLAWMIIKVCGFKGKIIWDSSKPDGQPRRCLDIARARKEIDFTPKTKLISGIRATIEWYKSALKKDACRC